MKEINLTRGKVALVDDDMYDYLSQFNWRACKGRNTFYAVRSAWINKKDAVIFMHTEILGKKIGYEIDHINGNGLDNRRCNLRHVSVRQNQQNRHSLTSSKYPGVDYSKSHKKWRARIRIDGVQIRLGYYIDEYQAYLAYKRAVKEMANEKVIWQETGSIKERSQA